MELIDSAINKWENWSSSRRTLWSRVSSLGPPEWMSVLVEQRVFLLDAKPRMLVMDFFHRHVTRVTEIRFWTQHNIKPETFKHLLVLQKGPSARSYCWHMAIEADNIWFLNFIMSFLNRPMDTAVWRCFVRLNVWCNRDDQLTLIFAIKHKYLISIFSIKILFS